MQETQETQVQSLGWKDPLEEGPATHSSILAWRIPGTEEPGGLQSIRLQRVGHNCRDLALSVHVNPNLPIHSTSSSSLGVHKFVLYICVSNSVLQIS